MDRPRGTMPDVELDSLDVEDPSLPDPPDNASPLSLPPENGLLRQNSTSTSLSTAAQRAPPGLTINPEATPSSDVGAMTASRRGTAPPPPPPMLRLAMSTSSQGNSAATAPTEMGFDVFKRHLATLLSMGFRPAAAEEALFRTRNVSVQRAVDWLLRQDEADLAALEARVEADGALSRHAAAAGLGLHDAPPPPPVLARHRTDGYSEASESPRHLATGGTGLAGLDLAGPPRGGLGYVMIALFGSHPNPDPNLNPNPNAAAPPLSLRHPLTAPDSHGAHLPPVGEEKTPTNLTAPPALEAKLDLSALPPPPPEPEYDIDPEEARTCQICYCEGLSDEGAPPPEDAKVPHVAAFPRCGHEFCHDCTARFLLTNISEGKVLHLSCPCNGVVPDSTCGDMQRDEVEDLLTRVQCAMRAVLAEKAEAAAGAEASDVENPPLPAPTQDEDVGIVMVEAEAPQAKAVDESEVPLLRKYRKFYKNKLAERDPHTRWCTRLGCETAIQNRTFWTAVTKKMVCPECDTQVCANCGRDYHGFMSCGTMTDAALSEYSRKKFLQPCPSCNRLVEKLNACPHITCPCGHQWCWVCRDAYPCTTLHFGVGGYGSSEEIGDLSFVWRLTILARMAVIFAFIYLLFPAVATVAALYLVVMAIAFPIVILSSFGYCIFEDDGDFFENKSWKVYCEMAQGLLFIVFGPILLVFGLLVLVAFIGAVVIVGVSCILPVSGLILLDIAGVLVRAAQACTEPAGEKAAEDKDKCWSLWTADFDSQFAFNDTYDGGLKWLCCDEDVRGYVLCEVLRRGAALAYLGVTVLPGIALSLVFLPVAPCCLCPALISPLGMRRFSFAFRSGISLAGGLAVGLGLALGLGFAFGVGEEFDDDGLQGAVEAIGLTALGACLVVCIGTVLVLYTVVTYPPVSNCSFAAPLWIGSVSPALVIALPPDDDLRKLAFGPTPNPIQMFD